MKKRSKVVLLCILIVVTVFTTLAVIYSAKTTPIPDDLIGVWNTSSPKYAQRFFEIKKHVLVFGTGKTMSDYGAISKVNKAVQDKNVLYTIYYESDQGGEQQFSFFYDAIDGGTIKFKNLKQIKWTKFQGNAYDFWYKHCWEKG